MRSPAVLVLLTGALACSWFTAPDAARFRVEETIYAPGATVSATLVNLSSRPLGFSFCNARLQRRNGSSWQTVDEALMICTLELRMLSPGGSATYTRQLPEDLATGVYRLQAFVGRDGPGEPISTQGFAVQGFTLQ